MNESKRPNIKLIPGACTFIGDVRVIVGDGKQIWWPVLDKPAPIASIVFDDLTPVPRDRIRYDPEHIAIVPALDVNQVVYVEIGKPIEADA